MAETRIENIKAAETITRFQLRLRFAKVLQQIDAATRQAISSEYICGLLAAAEMYRLEFAPELLKRVAETTTREHFAKKKRVARRAKKNAKQGASNA
jgi:hypothetical protein